jgi:hypothetical protein
MPGFSNVGVLQKRLTNLQGQKADRDMNRLTLSRTPLLPGQAPPSGFMGEKDYLQAQNDEAELLNIASVLSGKGMPTTRVGQSQTIGAGGGGTPGLRSSRPGMGNLSLAGGDDADPLVRENMMLSNDLMDQQRRSGVMDIEDRVTSRFDRAAADQAQNPEQALFSGRTGATVNAVGNLRRGEALEDARSAATTFMDPTVSQARGVKVGEDERLITARYGREADAAAKIEAARIAAGGKVDAANATAGGALTREAIRGLLKSREIQTMMGGQPMDESVVDQLMMRYAQPGGAGEQPQPVDEASLQALIAGARQGGDNSPAGQQLASWWPNMTPEQQARVRQAMAGGR